jgi:xanthine dehydrogenase accessory factor
MRELQGIVEAAEEAERSGKTAILATVVQVEGFAYAISARFPSADNVVLSLPETTRDRISLDKERAALVMTHNYLQDRKLLDPLLPSPVRYIGILGPKSRTDEILSDLRSAGVAWTEEQLARLHVPVGLDIGGEGPEGIALAILAEIQAVRSNRFGGFLRQRTGPIHVRSGSEVPANGQQP